MMPGPRTRGSERRTRFVLTWGLLAVFLPGVAAGQATPSPVPPPSAEAQTQAAGPAPLWQYGGFADLGYLLDFNDPANHLFRDRSTTFKVNELDLNMAALYVKKEA